VPFKLPPIQLTSTTKPVTSWVLSASLILALNFILFTVTFFACWGRKVEEKVGQIMQDEEATDNEEKEATSRDSKRSSHRDSGSHKSLALPKLETMKKVF